MRLPDHVTVPETADEGASAPTDIDAGGPYADPPPVEPPPRVPAEGRRSKTSARMGLVAGARVVTFCDTEPVRP